MWIIVSTRFLCWWYADDTMDLWCDDNVEFEHEPSIYEISKRRESRIKEDNCTLW
jgi:hypothetical protein